MKKQQTILFAVLATAILFVMNLTVAGAQGPPSQPSSFYGTVKVNGANVADGTVVTAWINGTQVAETTTQTWNGNSVYSMAVPNGNEGDSITFQVNGVVANESGTWQLGGNSELNLTVSSGPTPPVADFNCSPSSGQPPLTVSCTDASTGNITGWSWEFGDGSTSTDQNPPHTYNADGTYTVSLTVSGPDGSDTETKVNYISVSASNSGSMALQFQPSKIEMYADQVMTLKLMIKEAQELYGLEVDCSTDADFISLQNATFGDFFDADPLIGINNLSSNSWHGALSQKNPAPALSGNGLFATLTLKVLASGSAEFACQALASNGDGFPLSISTSASPITVLPGLPNAIVGLATYQSRQKWGGIQVSATGPTNKSVTTIDTGRFELLELSAGSYQIKAEAPGHLYSCLDTQMEAEKAVVLDQTKLLAGDVDNNNVIDIFDAIQVGNVFGQAATESVPTDFNADGTVDILDLTPLGRNFTESRTGCEGW